ncbi:MAG: M20/M25/M40 family metallo-hydrolase [Myxococcales bacterium]|nr:M20/M25/M40 family metallo-hydrolase [Myxococcales bacterium]
MSPARNGHRSPAFRARRPWTLLGLAALALTITASPSCKRTPDDGPSKSPDGGNAGDANTTDAWSTLGPVDVAHIRTHMEFLAADAQEGRAPGTEADQRVRAHVVAAMRELGLEPAFDGGGYEQAFEVTDGVRVRAKKTDMLASGRTLIEHNLVPWGHDTSESGPVLGRFIYLGYGLAGDEPWTGDYANLKGRTNRIVVVRAGGPDDPHLDPSKIRPQTKLITAREHGAIGFVLWEPDNESPYPNNGRVNDLQIPAVAVGASGTDAMLEIFGVKGRAAAKAKKSDDPHFGITNGTKSTRQGVIDTPVEPIVLGTGNVSGILRGNGSSPKRLVIGAHMDHLGMGNSHSLAPGERAVHNGADDNASGVATMLALAKTLASVPASERPYDIQFVAFGAEEMGLLGSKHLVTQLGAQAAEQIVAMLNFDMVGRMRDNTVIVAGAGTSSAWAGLLEKSGGGLTVKTNEQGYGASDQTSFYEVGIPVLHFFTGAHDDYHKPSDDLDKIDFAGAARIGDMAARVVAAIMSQSLQLDYKKVVESKPMRSGFRVSLGTIPDYAAQADGLALSGVRPGGAAEKAGLRKGDVIQKLGEREIHNMDDYMAAFAVLKPAVEIEVVVLRDGKQVALKITPEAPRRR